MLKYNKNTMKGFKIMKSVLAGIFIGIGCIVYLTVGGFAGAFLFSIGLIAVLRFKAELFTGKAGLLPTKEISIQKLIEIWIGNFIGTFLITTIIMLTPKAALLAEAATQIISIRIANGFLANLALGIPCGLLMYIAVNGFEIQRPIYAILPVMVFIMAGFNHCIADMGYCHIAQDGFGTLISTTFGNIIGGCIIPWITRLD